MTEKSKVVSTINNYYSFLESYETEFDIPFNIVDGYYEIEIKRTELYNHMNKVECKLREYGIKGLQLPEFKERTETKGVGVYRSKLISKLADMYRFIHNV